MHLIIDGHGGDPAKLGDPEIVLGLLRRLPSIMGMTVLREAEVIHYNGGDRPDAHGVTGSVIIAESHLTVHTFPDYRFAAFDASSCKDFDPAFVTGEVIEAFSLNPAWSHSRVIQRDLDLLLNRSMPEAVHG